MLFWHGGALQLRAGSLKVVTNLHEKEQTAVILTFYEEAQPTETASSATFALQVGDVSFATWIQTGQRVVGQAGVDFIPSIRTTGEAEELQARREAFAIRTAERQEVPEAPRPLVPSPVP